MNELIIRKGLMVELKMDRETIIKDQWTERELAETIRRKLKGEYDPEIIFEDMVEIHEIECCNDYDHEEECEAYFIYKQTYNLGSVEDFKEYKEELLKTYKIEKWAQRYAEEVADNYDCKVKYTSV